MIQKSSVRQSFLYLFLQTICCGFGGKSSSSSAETISGVIFPSIFDDLELEGTLRLPNINTTSSTSSNSVPGVVLIHGSGPNSRDAVSSGQLNLQFGFEIPIFQQIAEALQDAGIATLTYDKRSCGGFNGCSENGYPLPSDDLLIDTFMNDAISAAMFLKGRPEISEVIVAGHSQSGQFIPIMLESYPDLLDKGILLAGPFRPIDELLEFQYNSSIELLLTLGVNEAGIQQIPAIAAFDESLQALEGIRNGNISDDSAIVGGASVAFWNSWFDLQTQALEVSSNITQPILIVNGDMDWNVPVAEAYAWDDYLFEEAGLPSDQVSVFTPTCVTHALNCVNESNPALITPEDIARDVAPEVISALIEFVGVDNEPVAAENPIPSEVPTEIPVEGESSSVPNTEPTLAPEAETDPPTEEPTLEDSSSSYSVWKKSTLVAILAVTYIL